MVDASIAPSPSPLDLSIVIPVFNKCAFTRKCLESLDKHTTRQVRWEVIVVDNGSSDETAAYLLQAQTEFPWLRVVTNAENKGFSRACNQGVAASDAPAVLLLNNDTEATACWLEPMIRTLYCRPNVAAVGSKLLFADNTLQHAGVILLNDTNLGDPLLGRHIYFMHPADYPEAQLRRVYQVVTGACLLVKRGAYDAVGGLDEEYWNGYEDVDFCLKLNAKGWVCVYEPESVLYHHESQSGPERFRKAQQNTERLHRKWIGIAKADFIAESGDHVARASLDGMYHFTGADGLHFDTVLAALRETPVSAVSTDNPAALRARRPQKSLASSNRPQRYNIVLVQPEGYEHSGAFAEIADLLQASIESLGLEVRSAINHIDSNATNIILGYQLLTDPHALDGVSHIIYQLEQLSDREGWYRRDLLDLLANADEVWDYADENVAFLRERGITHVRHLPIGYHPSLRRISRQVQDIDVLFYGSLNPRRRQILEKIATFAQVKCLVSLYGKQRDEYVARSKVILNLHYYEAQIMEQARISYLLNNHVFVMSESSPNNPFGDSLLTASADELPELVRHYLHRPADRHRRVKEAFQAFRARSMVDYIRPLVTTPSPQLTRAIA